MNNQRLRDLARNYAERMLPICVERPELVVAMNDLRRRFDAIVRAADVGEQRPVVIDRGDAAIIATGLTLLMAETIERVDARRRAEIEKN